MRWMIIPKLYTVIAFGSSMWLWAYIPSIILMPEKNGLPNFLVHPYFAIEMILMLSTVFAWVFAALIKLFHFRSLANLSACITQNWLTVSLASLTVIVAISGCLFYSQPLNVPVYVTPHPSERPAEPEIPGPNPYLALNSFGVIFCEIAWIMSWLIKTVNRRNFRKVAGGPGRI